MRNAITLNGVTYDDDALRGISIDADVSLDERTLDVDTLEATVEGTDALTEISRSAPLRFLYQRNELVGIGVLLAGEEPQVRITFSRDQGCFVAAVDVQDVIRGLEPAVGRHEGNSHAPESARESPAG